MLTERMQQWMLYQLYYGKADPRSYEPADFDEPWRTGLLSFKRIYEEWDYSIPQFVEGDFEQTKAAVRFTADADWALQMAANLVGSDSGSMLRRLTAATPVLEFLSLEAIAATLPPITWLWEN